MLVSNCAAYYKKNKIVNKCLLSEDELMPELHLRQPGFTYIAWGQFTKHLKRVQKFEEAGSWKHIYKNKLDKAYSDSNDSAKRTVFRIRFWKIELMKLL